MLECRLIVIKLESMLTFRCTIATPLLLFSAEASELKQKSDIKRILHEGTFFFFFFKSWNWHIQYMLFHCLHQSELVTYTLIHDLWL